MTTKRDSVDSPVFCGRIDRHTWSSLGRSRYLSEYILPLNPVIITDGFDHWTARSKWTFDFFKTQHGDLPLEVDGRKLSMATLIDEVRASTPEKPAPYLRNHSIDKLPPELHGDVHPMPECTRPNWLENGFVRKWKDWTYPELYIGGTGAKFPTLHWDGKHTHAFLMQLDGIKEYIAFPPDQSPLMYAGKDLENENLSAVNNVETPDLSRFPLFAHAKGVRFQLHPGETLFVPAGWWHTARIVTPSITVSINCANAANWNDFSRDICRTYWRENIPKRAAGSAYLFLAGMWSRLTTEPFFAGGSKTF